MVDGFPCPSSNKINQLCPKYLNTKVTIKFLVKLNITPLQRHINQFKGVRILLNTNDAFSCKSFTEKSIIDIWQSSKCIPLVFDRRAILRIIFV